MSASSSPTLPIALLAFGGPMAPATVQARVILLGLLELGKPYSGPVVGQSDSMRWGTPGWDCSSFVSGMYQRATDGAVKLTGFTDAIFNETDPIDVTEAVPGDLVLWRYADPAQPGVTFPHVGLVYDDGLVLDCRFPAGVGVRPGLNRPALYRRVRGIGEQPAPATVLDASAIATALQASASTRANIERYWPMIESALAFDGILDVPTAISAAATVHVETGIFAPITEYATGDAYEGRADLGNVQPGDGPRYRGRGFVQITGRANYRNYGRLVGVDLEGKPALALEPEIAARVLSRYFKERGIPAMAQRGDWKAVRRAVNGGLNGYDTFIGAVMALAAI